MRAAAYSRVSSREQVEGLSLDAQARAIEEYARARGYEVAELYVDRGYSATSDKRPAFQQMLADAKAHRFDTILVHKLDRFSRNLEQSVTVRALLKREGIAVISVTEPMDDSPASFITESMLQVIAAWYSKNLSAEVAKGRRERFERGLWNGNLPFGYRRGDDGIPVAVDDEAGAVREAFARYATGMFSYQATADWLNEQGFRTRNVRKNPAHGITGPAPFTRDTIRDMLRNPFYKGLLTYRGKESRPGRQPAIVDEALWAATQRAARKRHHSPTTFVRPHRTYLLAGILRCASCGGKLWAHTTMRGHAYYREYSRQRGLPCTTQKGSVRTEKLDDQVGRVFEGLRLPPDWRDTLRAMLRSEDTRERVLSQRAKVEEKIRRLRTLYLELAITDGEYRRERERLLEQLQALSVPSERPVMDAGAYIGELPVLWHHASLQERRAIVLTVLDAVYVSVDTQEVVAIQPKADFRSLIAAASPTWEPAGQLLHGDPDRIRTDDLQLDKLAC